MSIVSGTVGAILGADQQAKATAANRKNVKDTNQLNKQMFDESRGSTGSAVLPLYLKTRNGSLFENDLGQNLMDAYNTSRPDKGAMDAAVSSVAPSEAAAQATGASVFSGGMQKQLEANAQPVQQARVTFARQNAMDALKKTLADIQATQAGRGYTGDSMANNQLRFEANKSASDAVGAASLQNTIDNQNIKNQVLQYQLDHLNLPATLAGQGADFGNLANQRFIDAVQQGLLPLNFLRIGTAQPFQYQGIKQDAIPSAAQLALSSVAQTGNTVLDAWLKNRQNQPPQTGPVVPTAGEMNNAAIGPATGASAGSPWAGGATTPTYAGEDWGAGAAAADDAAAFA